MLGKYFDFIIPTPHMLPHMPLPEPLSPDICWFPNLELSKPTHTNLKFSIFLLTVLVPSNLDLGEQNLRPHPDRLNWNRNF